MSEKWMLQGLLSILLICMKEVSCNPICDVRLYPSLYPHLSLHITSPPTLILSSTKETVWRLNRHKEIHSFSIRVIRSAAANLIGFYLCTNEAEEITLCEVSPSSVPPLWVIRQSSHDKNGITISVKKISNRVDGSGGNNVLYAEKKSLHLLHEVNNNGSVWLVDTVRGCDNVFFAKKIERKTSVAMKKTDICLSKTFTLFSKKTNYPCFSISNAAEIKLLLEIIFGIINEIIEQNAFTSNKLIMQLIEDVELMLASVAKELHDGKSISIKTRHVLAHIKKQQFPFQFPGWNYSDNIIVETRKKENEIYPMVGTLYQNRYLNNGHLFTVDNKTEKFFVNSKMIGAHVGPNSNVARVRITLNLLKQPRSRGDNNTVCAFWNTKGHDHHWATSGCRQVTASDNAKQIICECDHLTNFALLTAIDKFHIPITHKKILDTLSLLCCGISIAFLTIGIFIFLLLLYKEKKHRNRNAIHTNLMFSLWTAQIIFVSGIEATSNESTCTAVAYLLHYFLLCSFAWMLVEGLFLYMNMVKVFVSAALQYLTSYMASAYVFPALIVGITGVVSHRSYGTKAHCWLTTEDEAIWAFLAPMIIIVAVNTLILLMVLYKIVRLHKNNDSIINEVKVGMRSSLVLLPILGVTWVIGLANVNSDTMVIQYLFSLMNGLQGFMITLFHCFLNGDVRKSLKRIFKVWIRYYEVEKYFESRRLATFTTHSQTLSTKDSPALFRRVPLERPLHSTWPRRDTDLTVKVVNIINNQKDMREYRNQQPQPFSHPTSRPAQTSKVLIHPTYKSASKAGNDESQGLCGKVVSIMKHHQEYKVYTNRR